MKLNKNTDLYFDDDKPNDFCGIVGVYGSPDASIWTYLGLYSLQHRGQESAGIASSDGEHVHKHLSMGLVSDVFQEDVLTTLPGHIAIGDNSMECFELA